MKVRYTKLRVFKLYENNYKGDEILRGLNKIFSKNY
jgi:hypothetical protein